MTFWQCTVLSSILIYDGLKESSYDEQPVFYALYVLYSYSFVDS